MTMSESKMNDASPPASQESGSNAPSGFILKLFQMVNGAPDEVISWTPAGDAFIIGSDLNRLESETLPQFFRHNRFQSLVRQLNFYSFRKINRERNVWIYKHKLFHRDRPEDLFQVRRRTCPGVDGRKQRFSRYSAQKLSKYDDKLSDDDSSLDSNSGDESGTVSKKRRGSLSSTASNSSKRSRRLWQSDDKEAEVVTSAIVSPSSAFDAPKALAAGIDADDSSATNKKSDRMEMMEQSLIVSEVASKLEEFVKKAKKGRGSSRSRAGIVTPPYGKSSTISSRGLITYDDEYEPEEIDYSSGFVTDGEESVDSTSLSNMKYLDAAPIDNRDKVEEIVVEIRKRASVDAFDGKTLAACADVVEFLMTTAPSEACCNKVLELLVTSERLASDFHLYRSALNFDGKGMWSPASGESSGEFHTSTLRRAFESGSKKLDTLREFKIFAVNLVYKLLGKNGSFNLKMPFSLSETRSLLRTADAWSKSVHIGQVV